VWEISLFPAHFKTDLLMTFLWPGFFFALLLVPFFIAGYGLFLRRRQQIVKNYGRLGVIQGEKGDRPGFQRHIPPLFFLIGLIILILALTRPQAAISLPRVEGTVILAFDVSGSMAADDFKPTRMEAAKNAALDFVEHQPVNVQIGVVAFSDSGFSVQKPTYDHDTILASIKRLSPQRGTSLAQGIYSSLNALTADANSTIPEHYSNLQPTPTTSPTPVPKGTYQPAVIVLLTDGENNENPDPMAAAQAAADRGVRINTIGIGNAAGTILHVNGITVHTSLDEATLQQIADTTDGVYYNASNEADLLKIYDDLTPQLVIKPENTEITAVFAGAGLLVFLVGAILSFLWLNRIP
jgi:Ca-activated chloride channel family protein